MRKRRLIAVFIAIVISLGVSAMWSAATIQREGDPDANLIEDSGSEAGTTVDKKKGNKVVRILAAPFKAFGKLFGGKDDHKLQRMSEKDAEKFESVAVSRFSNSTNDQADKLDATASARDHLASGRSRLAEGRLNEAIFELSAATSLDPKLAEAHNLLGVAFAQKGMQDRAKESYERAVKTEPNDAQTLNNLGFTLYQNGNYRAAVDRLKRAVKLAPTDERILNNLGLALCRLGKFDDAYKHFARANGELMGNLNTARMLERFAREDDAIRYYEAARRIDGNNTVALRRLADLYQRVGRGSESQEAAGALTRVNSINAAVVGR